MDEGKYFKKEFSGAFVARGTDKSLDNMQSGFAKDGMYFNKQRKYSTTIKNEPLPIKHETWLHPKLEPVLSMAKTEVKQEIKSNAYLLPFEKANMAGQSGVSNKRESLQRLVLGTIKTEGIPKPVTNSSFGQGKSQEYEEADYFMDSDIFDDEMDLEEIDAIDSSVNSEQEVAAIIGSHNKVSSSQSPVYANQNSTVLSSSSNKLRASYNIDQAYEENKSAQLSHNHNLANVREAEIDLFEDDFEIDDVMDPTLSEHLKFCETQETSEHLKFSPLAISQNVYKGKMNLAARKTPCVNSTSVSKSVNMFQPCKKESSQNIQFKNVPTQKLSAVPLPNAIQKIPQKKSSLFKAKISHCHEIAPSKFNTFGSQQMKQCKLSDMFVDNSNSNREKNVQSNNEMYILDCESNSFTSPKQTNTVILNATSSRLASDSKETHIPGVSVSCLTESKVVNSSQDSQKKPLVMIYNTEKEQQMTEQHKKLPMDVNCTYKSPENSGSDCIADSSQTDKFVPYGYLSEAAKLEPPATFTVKAYISTLTDKLNSCGGTRWSLACKINDGTACLDVELSNQVLTELIGFSAQDSVIMRQRMKTDRQIKETLMEGLTQCQKKLINISCLMEVEFVSRTTKPIVNKFVPVSKQQVQQFIEKLERKLLSLQT